MVDYIRYRGFLVYICVAIVASTTIATTVEAQRLEWTKLVLEENIREQNFGRYLATVGNHLLVGTTRDTLNGHGSGSIRVIDLSAAGFPTVQKLVTSDGQADDYFGGNLIASGTSIFSRSFASQKVYHFELIDSEFLERQILNPPSNIISAPDFGGQLQANSQWVAFRARNAVFSDGDQLGGGAVFIYKKIGEEWTYHSMLAAFGSYSRESFASNLCLSDNTIAVGDVDQDEVYVYEVQDDNWILQKTFSIPGIGGQMTCSTDEIVLHASDKKKSYLFTRDSGVWSHQPRLVSIPAFTGSGGGINTMSIREDYLFIHNNEDIDGLHSVGRFLVFKRSQGTWVFDSFFRAPDYAAEDGFGYDVELSDEYIIVGAAWRDYFRTSPTLLDLDENGAVYIANRDEIAPRIETPESVPSILSYSHAYPNPANQSITLTYGLTMSIPVQIKLYDPLGRLIRALAVSGSDVGFHSTNIDTSELPNGVYYYQIHVGSISVTQPLTVFH